MHRTMHILEVISSGLGPQNAPKSLAAGGFAPEPLRDLTAFFRPPAAFKGPTSKGKGAPK